MHSKLILAVTLAAGCYKATGQEICAPTVTSWASPTYACLGVVPEMQPPVAPAPPPPAPKTEVTQEQIKLKEKIEFQEDSAVLVDSSRGLLDEIVQVMRDHPEIEHVRVAGHTSSEGAREHNVKLSEERAASVTRYLIDHGIATARLSSKGYGPDRPIADNKTEAGRAENRRVEIHILRRKGETKDRDPDAK